MSDQIHQFYNQMTLGHNDYNERKQGKGEGIMKKKVLGTALAFILGMSVLTGCGNSTAEANSKDASSSASTSSEATEKTGELNKTDHLNIALQPIPGYLPVTVLQDKGWLEEALAEAGYDNVEVTYTEFESGPPENEAFASGTQDLGVMGNVPTISGAAAGQSRSIIGVAYNGEKTEAVIVPKDSEIKDVKELKGKNIGLVVGSIAQDYLDRLLEKEGIASADVNLVNLAVSEQLNALATGQVDAIVTWQPTLAKAEAQEIGKVLVDGTGVYKCENLISGNAEYIEENPEIVQIFVQQYARAAAEVSNNIPDYAAQYADKYGLDASIVEATLKDINYQVSILDEDVDDFQATADWLYNAGNVKTSVKIKDIVVDNYANDDSIAELLSK